MIAGAQTRVVRVDARGIDGRMHEQTGLVHTPSTPPPTGGWPFVVYGHMTTGGGPRSAPSAGYPGHPEWRRMSQGDALCGELAAHGVAVLRPDYEGIGGVGVHPYLIADSLAESMLAMVRARHRLDDRIGSRWVSAGHSEGALAALAAGAADPRAAAATGSTLAGIAAFAPVTRLDRTIDLALRAPGLPTAFGVLPALIGLMLRGAGTVDRELATLLHVDGGGLGEAALAHWDELGTLTLTELAAPGSWGGIPPAAILGRRGDDVRAALFAVFAENDPAALTLPRVPVRIDAAVFDEVAPAPMTARLERELRRRGADLVMRWWPTHHSGVMHPRNAPSAAVAWILARLRQDAP